MMRFVAIMLALSCPACSDTSIHLQEMSRYETGAFDQGAAEISAYDPSTRRLFITNAAQCSIDIVSIDNPAKPRILRQIDLRMWGGTPNSVAVHGRIVAVAVGAEPITDPGTVVFFDTDGRFQAEVEVGALPDMVTFTANGVKLLVANEGEPADDVDPPGTISVIDLSGGVANATVSTATFESFDGQEAALRAAGVRIFPGKTVSEDLEPEYIALSSDGRTAYVTLQENNALAVVDVASARVTDILPLGVKDHNKGASTQAASTKARESRKHQSDARSNHLDASNRDEEIRLRAWPVFGMYMPDAIARLTVNEKDYYLTANEGDTRNEDARVMNLKLDPTAFPDAELLQQQENLGRLKVSTIDGDIDGDGDYDRLYSYGARSFSIWDSAGKLVFDSGDDFERITANLLPDNFNSNNDKNNSFDSRSDDRGPEPEAITVGAYLGRKYAFIGLERIGGIMVYDVSNPSNPVFVEYVNNRDFSGDPESGTAGDLAPEGLLFIPLDKSPIGTPLLIVSNEVSGTTTIYRVTPTKPLQPGRSIMRR